MRRLQAPVQAAGAADGSAGLDADVSEAAEAEASKSEGKKQLQAQRCPPPPTEAARRQKQALMVWWQQPVA